MRVLQVGDRVVCSYPGVTPPLNTRTGTLVRIEGDEGFVDFIGDGLTTPKGVNRPLAWLEREPEPGALNPDCAAGKHHACRGDAWDLERDQETPCTCQCHSTERTTP